MNSEIKISNDLNDIRYNLYNDLSKNFKYKTYKDNKNNDIVIDYTNKLPDGSKGAIEKSYNFEFVKRKLIDKLFVFFSSPKIFHKYIHYSKLYNKFGFLKQQLYIFSNLLLEQNTTFTFKNPNDIQIDSAQKKIVKEFLCNKYLNKKIDGIYKKKVYINFDSIVIDENLPDDSIIYQFTSNELYILFCYKNGLFNYYNHMVDLVNSCNDPNFINGGGDLYYCNRAKIGAIKTLEYYLISELVLHFVTDIKSTASNKILLSNTDYNDTNYGCNTISTLNGTPSKLEIDIRYFIDKFINLSSTINIESELINQKFYKSKKSGDDIKKNEAKIFDLDENTFKVENINKTLKDKNDNILHTSLKSRIYMILVVCVMAFYIMVNLYIFSNSYAQSRTLLVNTIIFLGLILYLYLDYLKKISYE
jgi:hypothetical protein